MREERLWCITPEGKRRASAKGCFAPGCGCVYIKKVATTGTFNKHLMGDIHTLSVLVSALAGCGDLPRLPLHLGVIQPVPLAQFCKEMLWCCNVQEKWNPEHSPSLSARWSTKTTCENFCGPLVFLLCCRAVL